MTDKDKKIQKKQRENPENGDDNLWALVTKDVTPLKKENTKTIKQEIKTKAQKRKAAISEYQNPPQQTKEPTHRSNETDHRTAQKLKRGQIQIEGRLDLHGLTQNEAYDALLSFIPNAYHQEKRCILIITGKGYKRESSASLADTQKGILKQKTPEWLNSAPLNTYVLRIEAARPNHGGEGALYVLLRRNR